MIAAVYVFTAPIYPAIYKSHSARNANIPSSRVVSSSNIKFQISIPSIGIEEIVDVKKEITSDLWHVRHSSLPGDGNTVIVGHRFSYIDPISPPFYDLDKVEIGDHISIRFETNNFLYEVDSVFTVEKDDTSIERQTEKPVLTVYTCTPLLNPTHRLVVRAKLVSID